MSVIHGDRGPTQENYPEAGGQLVWSRQHRGKAIREALPKQAKKKGTNSANWDLRPPHWCQMQESAQEQIITDFSFCLLNQPIKKENECFLGPHVGFMYRAVTLPKAHVDAHRVDIHGLGCCLKPC